MQVPGLLRPGLRIETCRWRQDSQGRQDATWQNEASRPQPDRHFVWSLAARKNWKRGGGMQGNKSFSCISQLVILAIARLDCGKTHHAMTLYSDSRWKTASQKMQTYLHGLVNERGVKVAGNEASPDALDLVWARGATRDDRGLCRLHSHNLQAIAGMSVHFSPTGKHNPKA